MPLQNITIIGASGNIGAPILSALLSPPTPFTLTVLTRPTSTAVFPPSVRVLRVDLASLPALTAALAGQDAVVSCVPIPALAGQRIIVDACVAAGVRRFLPSDFGHNVVSGVLGDGTLARLMNVKREVIAYMEEAAGKNPGFTWTGVATGMFFEICMEHGVFGVDWERKEARMVDSGEERAGTCSMGFVGRAVRRVLETAAGGSEVVDVVECEVSLNEVRRLLEEEGGVEIKVVKRETAVEVQRRADEAVARGDMMGGFVDLLMGQSFQDGAGRQVKKTANEELGLVGRSARELVREWVRGKGAK